MVTSSGSHTGWSTGCLRYALLVHYWFLAPTVGHTVLVPPGLRFYATLPSLHARATHNTWHTAHGYHTFARTFTALPFGLHLATRAPGCYIHTTLYRLHACVYSYQLLRYAHCYIFPAHTHLRALLACVKKQFVQLFIHSLVPSLRSVHCYILLAVLTCPCCARPRLLYRAPRLPLPLGYLHPRTPLPHRTTRSPLHTTVPVVRLFFCYDPRFPSTFPPRTGFVVPLARWFRRARLRCRRFPG